MSETVWSKIGEQPSWALDTPVGRATISQLADDGQWVAQLDVDSSTRQSEWLTSRDEAESWVAQQVEAVQRESDVATDE
jgi:hypothetical protein